MPGLTLAIETSNPSAQGPGGPGVAVRCDGVIHTEPVGTGREDDLMPAIDRLFRRLGRAPKDIDLIAASIGPGGFTALRVCITVVKTLAFANNARCVGVPTARALALAARRDAITEPIAVLLASKGDTSFATVFPTASEVPTTEALIDASALDTLGVRSLVCDQFLPTSFLSKSQSLGLTIRPPRFSAAAVLELGESLAAAQGPTPIDDLAPIYPREPEAVTKWRRLHPDQPA